jgi:CRISPR-associated protein (TIGR03986 family)
MARYVITGARHGKYQLLPLEGEAKEIEVDVRQVNDGLAIGAVVERMADGAYQVVMTTEEASKFIPPYHFVRPSAPPKRKPFVSRECLKGKCGMIRCKLTTLTPIFIPDAEGLIRRRLGSREQDEHREMGFFSVRGHLAIPPTSLKGPIRSVAEAVSNSCFSVFEDQRFAWRRATNLPHRWAAMSEQADEASLKLRLYDREDRKDRIGRPKDRVRLPEEAVRDLDLSTGVEVEFDAVPGRGEYSRPIAVRVKRRDTGQQWAASPPSDSELSIAEAMGIVKTAQKGEGTNKQYDRVFYPHPAQGPEILVRDDGVRRYRGAYGDALPPKGELLYYANKRHGRQGSAPDRPGESIGPVEMYREAYDHSTGEALGDLHDGAFLPERCTEEKLCPACRLFGKVGGGTAIAGRVSINTAWLCGSPPEMHTVPLRVLGTPHPQYFPFYLRGTAGEGEAVDYNRTPWHRRERDDGSRKNCEPDDGQFGKRDVRARGRKFYWHHSDHSGAWEYYKIEEAHRETNPHFPKTNQNATVELLPAGCTFEFTVDFENLEDHELGLLLWSLALEDRLAHKIGMGKPIGLGSVKIEILELRTRKLECSYTDLFADDEMDETGKVAEYVAAFRTWLAASAERAFDQLENVQDLRAILSTEPLTLEPSYHPPNVRPDQGYEYYMKNRHNALVPLARIRRAGFQQHDGHEESGGRAGPRGRGSDVARRGNRRRPRA